MRYELELEINAPRDTVAELMMDHENLQKWQPDLLSVEHLSGEPGTVGSKTKQVNKQGGRTLEIIETITVSNPPGQLCATYEAGSVWNLIECRFHPAGENKTKWLLASEFRTTSIFMKLLVLIAPGMFRKQTKLFMKRFKEFAESSG